MKTATKTFQWLVFLLLVIPHVRLAADASELSEQLLGLTDEMRNKLDGATQHGFMEIAPVNLPVNPPGNWFGSAAGPKKSDRLVVLQSDDGGEHWKVESHEAGFQQYEPAVLFHDKRFLIVTRNQTTGSDHRQMTWLPGEKPGIIGTNLADPRYVDTVDLSFNPVTRRLELIRSERYRMELWLWSIAPADWQTGQWRRECRLLARKGKFYSTADGFHPAGAVVDEKHGVQHIFIYAGHPNGPAGVFRITRTLDTPKLTSILSQASRR